MMGVPVQTLVAAAFGLCGAFAGLAAIVAAPSASFSTQTGLLLGVKGLVAALLVASGRRGALRRRGRARDRGGGDRRAHGAGYELGPEYREVLPIAAVLLLVALRPPRQALEEQE